MKRRLSWKAALAAVLMGVGIFAPLVSVAQTIRPVPVVANRPLSSGWMYYGYSSRIYYDQTYGWVKVETTPDGWVTYYTYGYQIVYVWTNNGYRPTYHRGYVGTAYPVVYGPRP